MHPGYSATKYLHASIISLYAAPSVSIALCSVRLFSIVATEDDSSPLIM